METKMPEITDCIFGVFDNGSQGGILLNKEAAELVLPAIQAAVEHDIEADNIITTLFLTHLTLRYDESELYDMLNYAYKSKHNFEKAAKEMASTMEAPKRDIDDQSQRIHVTPNNKYKS